ncbi:MAG: DUF1049 domain-containing protein [Legionellales bacterium]|nr:DUF1049 domain-containing protein [Legionellales bacterium]
MRIIRYSILFILLILGVTFACLNASPVMVHYYIGNKELPLALLLAFALGGGAFLGIMISLFPLLRLKTENFRLRQRIKTAEQEVANLRSIPIQDKH